METVWCFSNGFGSGSQALREKTAEVLPFLKHHGWTVRHIFKELNHAADELAKLARRSCWEWSRLDAIPRGVAIIRHMTHC